MRRLDPSLIMLILCIIPGLLVICGIMVYFSSEDRFHGALDSASEPIEVRTQEQVNPLERLAPAPVWDDRQTAEPESSETGEVCPASSVSPPSPQVAPASASQAEKNEQLLQDNLRRLMTSVKVQRMSGTSSDPEYMQVDTWAKEDPVFQRCVEDRSGVWVCMPMDATRSQVKAFRDLIRPTLLEYAERLKSLQEAAPSTDSPDWSRGWWELRRWERDRYMMAFMVVWPDCQASDPMPSVLPRKR